MRLDAWLIIGLCLGINGVICAEDQSLEPGLVWVFFHDTAMTRPGGTGVDLRLDMDTGAEIHDFSKVWFGRIEGPRSGVVVFSAEADDGLRLWVGDELVIDGWARDGAREGRCLFSAKGQVVPCRLEYFQEGGTAHLRLYWSWEGHARELVSSSAFWHDGNDKQRATKMAGIVVGAEEVPLENAKARVCTPGQRAPSREPARLGAGPHLFLDDFLVESSENVQRVVNAPLRDSAIPNPLVTGKEDGCFQPYMTVLRDSARGIFRLWYGHHTAEFDTGRSRIGYLESKDGIHWMRPARILEGPGPIQFGVSVIDERTNRANQADRFKFGWYMDGGLKIARSPDGLAWTPLTSGVVLRHNHDINSIFYDPLRGRYTATISVYRTGGGWTGQRRITMQSFSNDLLKWETPHYVLLPDPKVDEGETQFYAMEGYLLRGDLLVGMVKVLRDDLKADDPPDPPDAYGIGYTTLAWTRDGETWTRDPSHFFDPDPTGGTWDHAHAWIDEQVLVDDEVYLYYGGYARGHKVNRFEERQIGLVKMKRDRYVARQAGSAPGMIRTPLLLLDATAMTLNVDAKEGRVDVQVLDAHGRPIPGFGRGDCRPVTADALAAPVTWKRSLEELRNIPVRLEFQLTNARLFAFDLR